MIRAVVLVTVLALLSLLLVLAHRVTEQPTDLRVRVSDHEAASVNASAADPRLPDNFGELVAGAKVARSGPKRTAPNKPAATGSVPDIIRRVFARFGAQVAEQAVRVAGCESRYDPNARLGPNIGVFQLNGQFHRARAARLGFSWSQMSDPFANATVAADLYSDSGWGPWSCKWAAA